METDKIQQVQNEKTEEAENRFDIPGIHRYTNGAQNIGNDENPGRTMSGLPGLDKFSNRKEQAEKEALLKKKEEEIPVFVPPLGAEAAEAAVTAGTAVLSGLPGLDKFSNRKEQAEKKATEIEQTVADAMPRQTMEDDPFGIPGIKRYTGFESTQPEEKITED